MHLDSVRLALEKDFIARGIAAIPALHGRQPRAIEFAGEELNIVHFDGTIRQSDANAPK